MNQDQIVTQSEAELTEQIFNSRSYLICSDPRTITLRSLIGYLILLLSNEVTFNKQSFKEKHTDFNVAGKLDECGLAEEGIREGAHMLDFNDFCNLDYLLFSRIEFLKNNISEIKNYKWKKSDIEEIYFLTCCLLLIEPTELTNT